MTSILAHYSELALKGRNRPWFIHRLVRHLHGALKGLSVGEIRTPMGRIEVVLNSDVTADEVRDRMSRVFGLANYSLALRVPLDFDGMASAMLGALPATEVGSFSVKVRRADKAFPVTSPVLAGQLGSRIIAERGWKVDLEDAELQVRVEIVPGQAFCYIGKEPGAGGLPIGTGGRVVALLSGGIDSPVAAWRLMRRGCDAVFVHFHSVPFLSRTSQDKARQLVEVLTRYQLRSRLYLVPFGDLQRQLTMTVPGDLRVIVYRRMMLRIAERIGRRVHAKALVTGEVVGQVASQTLDNINVIAGAAYMPILRPLIALDKEEIIAQAQQLGTYAISIVPDEDCCTLFTPRHPETHARRFVVDEIESKLPIAEMIASAIAATEMEQLAYPVIK
ncbi:MAG: tRNA uracil 4-sulfurtransferase ThiI [Vicinamibacterales bacterium]